MAIDLIELATAIGKIILRFRMKRATTAEWAAANTILLDAELGYDTDLKLKKVGDGVTPWNSLTYDGIVSLVAGTNVTIDNSDPQNPVINATSGGGGGGGGGEIGPDNIPSSPNAMDDEFNGSSLDAKWTWQQQNTASIAEGTGRLVMTGQITSGNTINALEQNLPGGNCAFVVKASAAIVGSGNFAGAIHLRESSTGDTVAIGFFNNGSTPQTIVAAGTMSGGYSAVPAAISFFGVGALASPIYFKAELSGTTLILSISVDGLIWFLLASIAFTTYFSSAPDRIGFATRSNNGTTPALLCLDYFRRIS